jgi:integrase
MARAGKRRRLATNIYRDGSGIAAVAKANGQRQERRYPPDTPLEIVRDWIRVTVARFNSRHPPGRSGTLAGDAKPYLAQMRHLASFKARRVEVYAWVTRLGPETIRSTVTAAQVMAARVAWLKDGLSPKTINNRVDTLRHWFRTLDGPSAETPCDSITPLPVPKTPAIVIPADLVQRVDAELQRREHVGGIFDAKTRARFRVLATTGKRPSEIMRAKPGDVDLVRRVWIVRDGKGGFSPGLYLNDDMKAAWELFIAAEAWGPFNTNSMARTLRRAGWPAGVRPYNLRHTTWITASERGVDLADIQQGAGHKNLATTRRHYVPVLNSRMQRLSEVIDRRYEWTVPPSVPPEARGMAQNPAPTRGANGRFLAASKRRKR